MDLETLTAIDLKRRGKSMEKPLGRKAYGSIPHLPDSRMGPADHSCHEGQARIATAAVRDSRDRVIVQEKLDGSCVAVAKVDGIIHALGRAGHLASTSPHRQHHAFAAWVGERGQLFARLLKEGERVVGEWLLQAHGTRYEIGDPADLFVAFDLMVGTVRSPYAEFSRRVGGCLRTPAVVGYRPMPPSEAMWRLKEYGCHGAIDPIEGAVWRVERDGVVDFLVKWVRPDKVDGAYLETVTGDGPVWNWKEGDIWTSKP
jgi:hypothetical protein